jgi:maltooligosyltrehalose trehalohydrolase
VLHVALTGESAGYYEQYTGNTPLLARALAEGFAFQGEVMHCRGSARGEPCAHLPPAAFVSFLQNHDQVGNRAFGERLAALVPAEKLRAAAAVQLLAPQVPMLFMGEEWSARQPFLFFCDFAGDLGEAVRRGRREEFKRFPEFADPERRAHIPDPQSAATFDASRLEWRDLALPAHAHALRWHERILAMRRAHVVPLVRDITRAGAGRVIADGAVLVQWHAGTRRLTLCANLSGGAAEFPAVRGTCFWHEGAAPGESGAGGMTLAPWSVRWTISDASGDGTSE